jgi:hypothetical protein
MSGEGDERIDEPRRLANSGASPSAQMIRAVRKVAASPAAKQRLIRRASWLTLVSVLSSYAKNAAAALSSKTVVVMTGVGLAAGVGAYALKAPSPSDPAHPAVAQSARLTSTPPPPATVPEAVGVEEPVEVEEPADVEEPTDLEGESAAVVARKAGARPKAADQRLSEEIRLVDSARSAVRNARAGEALSRLDQYGRRFPNGRFSLEASALRIEALAALGERAQARTLAQRFIKRHPKSLLVERVRPYAAAP